MLYDFSAGGVAGFAPNPGLIFDRAGNLYGTTSGGGGSGGSCESGYSYSCGTVFELSPNGSGGWMATSVYGFQGGSDGFAPHSGLIFDQAGNLYGTTAQGGTEGEGSGTVFELGPNGSGGWTETLLYRFQGGSDGWSPEAGLIFDRNGNLYGASFFGGGTACYGGSGCGTTFELSPNSGGVWTETLLHRFQGGNDGANPEAALILDQTGNLYGTTFHGGGTGCYNGYGCGVAFEVSIEPFVAFSPTSLNFGNQTVGTGITPTSIPSVHRPSRTLADISQFGHR
jgi:hypothetical protein